MSGDWRPDAAPQARGPHTDSQPAPEQAETAAPAPMFGSVEQFVQVYLRKVCRPRIDGRPLRWAADWWRYPEAVARLTALWQAWEHLRLDPATGPSVWWRDHFDHHMAVLLGENGPFAETAMTDADKSSFGDPLPHTPPTHGEVPDERRMADTTPA